VPFPDNAGVIGKHLNLRVVSIAREEADVHFGFLDALVAFDITNMMPGSSAQTRELLGWQPAHPTLLADLKQGHYFKN
jgi:hypothetical protein